MPAPDPTNAASPARVPEGRRFVSRMSAVSDSVSTIPLVVLGGSDAEPAALPEGADKHPIRGHKGIEVQVEGRPLIDHVLDRMLGSGHLGPAYVAGPQSAYGERRGEAEVIDTDANLGENLRVMLEALATRHPGESIAITTCDIIPEPEDLDEVLADYHAHTPVDFWYPLVIAKDEELGESAWKPRYRLRPSPEAPARTVLPGHLIIVDPEVFRTEFVYRAFDLLYRSRNRPVGYRLVFMLTHLLGWFVAQDVRSLLHLRPPVMTGPVTWQGVRLALRLRRGEMTADELADRVRAMLVRWRHRKGNPDRQGRIPMVHAVSLAKDIDTIEEAEEQRRRFRRRRGRSRFAP